MVVRWLLPLLVHKTVYHVVMCIRRLLLLLLLIGLVPHVLAYESDQYSNRPAIVSDSTMVMDRKVNDALALVIKDWGEKRRSNKAFARAIYFELGGLHWADKIERWAAKTDLVEKYPQTRRQSIYQGMPIWATRVNFVFGVGRSFKVNEVMVGSDKFGHFFSQGFKYYKRELKGWDAQRLYARAAFAERWLWGQLTTGVYSNADLVANYEGMLFYKSLFENDVIEGKRAILRWKDGKPEQIRQFTWADHINDYWDEVLNPSFNVASLDKRLRPRIRKLCGDYETRPELYVSEDDELLWERYYPIGMKDNRRNLFLNICDRNGGATGTSQALGVIR